MGSAQNYSDSAEYASLRQIRGTALSSRYYHRRRRAMPQSDLWVANETSCLMWLGTELL